MQASFISDYQYITFQTLSIRKCLATVTKSWHTITMAFMLQFQKGFNEIL